MGMYTIIIHPEDGRELQIKAGWDDMEVYKVGDEVKWKIFPEYPGEGKLLDGYYHSYSDKGMDDCVVIKDHKVVGVIPVEVVRALHISDEIEDIVPYNRSWWSESAWIEKEIKELECELKNKKELLDFLKTLVGKSDEEIKKAKYDFMVSKVIEPVTRLVNCSGFARKVLKTEKL